VADDEKPFSNAFDALQDLKRRLPQARRPPVEKAPEPPPVTEPEATPAEPEDPEADFSAAMEGLGVEAIETGPDRIAERPATPRPAASGGRRSPSRPRSVATGLRGREEGFDESTPRLDLHGMSVENALAEVQRRVAAWRKTGIPRARIVTGRGSHSGDGQAAIRDAVERWLRRAPGAVGVYRARPDSGGEGVVLFEQLGKGKKR
jgi:DNA-nicking Smr family endonuclease